MRISDFLTDSQVTAIHRNALRVLAEGGVLVEHAGVRARLREVGGVADGERVRFPASSVERCVADAPKKPFDASAPRVALGCGIYQSWYLDPVTDEQVAFDEERLARYIALAASLGSMAGLLGLPFVPEGMSPTSVPLLEKLYAWKYGAQPFGSVQLTALCGPLLELFACHADAQGRRLEDIFCATGYLISPLTLARPECEQLLYFHERGLAMTIGHMPMQGASAPVTFAGVLTLTLAEQLFLFLLRRAFRADAEFAIGSSLPTLDMRTGASCLGRPEMQRANLAFADLARFYGCACWGHGGLTDAKRPSVEAGVQKTMGALSTALATGACAIEGGLLGMDEICSPVQLVLDADLVDGLNALLTTPDIDEASCAVEEILAVGPGGAFLDTELTAAHCRDLFTPRTWAGQFTAAWQRDGGKADVDYAREIALAERPIVPRISEEEERALKTIIKQASIS